MKIIVDADWLANHLTDPHVKVVDCRFSLANSVEGKEQYDIDHIRGASYFDLEQDLSGPVKEHGGRHPLPDLHQLKRKLEKAGISNDTTVVAYDQGVGAFAARFWWLLTYMGHENVYILNGGYRHWREKGYVVTTEKPKKEQAVFHVNANEDMLARYDEVKKIVLANDQQAILIDSREEKRYLGIEEPIDKKSGRIPRAVNKVWLDVVDNGFFKEKAMYERHFDEFTADQPLIVYCGSGVTAIPNYIALKIAGYEDVKVYIGSFSDWITYEENEIHKG